MRGEPDDVGQGHVRGGQNGLQVVEGQPELRGHVAVYTTDMGELLGHWASLTGRFDSRFATSLLGVTQLPAPQLLVMLEATAVD